MCVLLDECLDKLLPPLMPTLQVAVYIHVSPDPFDVRYKVKTDGIFKTVWSVFDGLREVITKLKHSVFTLGLFHSTEDW